MNSVKLFGRIGKDPEVRFLESGQAVANLSMATTEKWTKDGQKQERTLWHRLVLWGKQAELAGKFIHKGDQLLVEGKIDYKSYEKDGHKMYSTDIIVNQLHFVGGSKQSGQQHQEPEQQEMPSTVGL